MHLIPRKIQNLFILTDLESVAGVERFDQTREKTPGKAEAMKLLTKEVNAVIKGIRAYNPHIRIHVWDGHGSGGIVKKDLAPVEGYLPSQWHHQYNYFKENNIDALIFVGQHAMSYTFNGNQCHTMSSKNTEYYSLNGELHGEFGLRAAIAGELRIPTIYISGDDKACLEAKNHVPDIVTTTVMYGTGWESAISLDPEEVHRRQFEDIQIALMLAEKGHISPYIVGPPISLVICKKNFFLLQPLVRKGGTQISFKSVLFQAESLKDLVDRKVL